MTISLVSVSVSLFLFPLYIHLYYFLGSTYKWYIVFVFFCLTYVTKVLLCRSIYIVANGTILFFFHFLRNSCRGCISSFFWYFKFVWSTFCGFHCFQQHLCCQSYFLFPCMPVKCLFFLWCFKIIFLFLILNSSIGCPVMFSSYFFLESFQILDLWVYIFNKICKILAINFPSIFPYPNLGAPMHVY